MAVGLGVIPQFPASISTSDASILVSVANGIFDFKVNPNGTASVAGLNFNAGTAYAFNLSQRSTISTQAVVLLQPLANNSCIAFDLRPKGPSPVPAFPDLYTWIDLADADYDLNPLVPYTLLSIRNRANVLDIGSQIGNGATPKPLTFSFNAAEIMRMNATGLGIGTTAINAPLTISRNAAALPSAYPAVAQFGGANAIAARNLINSFGGQAIISLQRADGTGATPTALLNAEPFGQVEFGGYVGSNGYNVTASVLGVTEEAWSNTAQGSAVSVSTTQATTAVIRETARFRGTGALAVALQAATPAGGTTGLGLTFGSATNLGLFFGSGVPTLSAAQGSLYIRTDGSSTSTRAYVNTNGTTGWAAITTAS